MVVRCLARLKLGGFRYTRSLWYAVSQIAGAFRGTLMRAVVHVSTLRWSAVEHSPTDRTDNRGECRGATRQCSTIRFSTFVGAVDKSRLIPLQPVGLDRQFLFTVAALNIHTPIIAGTGTTLVVA